MTTARDVAHVLEQIAPLDSGVPGDQLGFVHGDPESSISGVACVWCVDSGSLRRCAESGLDMVICHEALWLPAQTSPWYEGPDETRIVSTRLRHEFLHAHHMVVYRSHSNWDALPGDGIADSAVEALGLPDALEVGRQRFFSVHELPEAISVQDLKNIVQRGLGFAACRAFGDPATRVRRFAFLIGGFGENQLHMPQAAREMGADAIIIGEMSEFIVIACLEMGLPVIESLHSVSEIPGIRAQARLLAERLPVPVQYVPSGAHAFAP